MAWVWIKWPVWVISFLFCKNVKIFCSVWIVDMHKAVQFHATTSCVISLKRISRKMTYSATRKCMWKAAILQSYVQRSGERSVKSTKWQVVPLFVYCSHHCVPTEHRNAQVKLFGTTNVQGDSSIVLRLRHEYIGACMQRFQEEDCVNDFIRSV